jgi:uncharacterized protein YndB with AHSA1/START domain
VSSQPIRWRMHLKSPPSKVYEFLSTAEGRSKFWAESALEVDGQIVFKFPNGMEHRGLVLSAMPPQRYSLRYFGDSECTFELASDGKGGTDLTLTDSGVPEQWWQETHAGWLSVLFALKAAADHGIDLRNHDPERTWDQGFADN